MATLNGTPGDDSLVGGSADDELFGLGGDDTLKGAGGADTLDGGSGDDLYIVGAGDILADSGGIDTVRTAISWDLGAGFENLIIVGHDATSSQGNDLDNRMEGNDADNYFNARGGNDTLIGGAGDDYFDMSPGQTSSPGNDSIEGGDGIDTVDFDGYAQSAVAADLVAGTVTGGGQGGAGDSVIHGIERFIGGGFDDQVFGSSGADYLDARGGDDSIVGREGADEMLGGGGNDTLDGSNHRFGSTDETVDTLNGGLGDDVLIVDNPADALVDAGGNDTVEAFNMGWTLAAGYENLVLHTGALEALVDGTGNSAANLIDGTGGWHVHLDGKGGADTLLGSPQEDTLQGRSGGDVIDGGDDYDLITGNGGADTLAGGWDFREDTLTGGAGRDRFLFLNSQAPGADVLTDFTTQIDELAFDTSSGFGEIGASGNFAAGDARFYAAAGATAGHDASDRLVYDTSSGRLYYDPDGSGPDAASAIADLQGHPQLVASDITVI
jgi:Ca2+-binding RTX toxin-like protein